MKLPSRWEEIRGGMAVLGLKAAYVTWKTSIQAVRFVAYHLLWKRG